MTRPFFWVISAILVVAGVLFGIWFGYEGWPKAVYIAAPAIGSLLVAVSWIATSLNTITNSEREHTLAVLGDYRKNALIKARWDIIYNYLDEDSPLKPPGKGADYPSDHEVYDAVFELLNEYEYIAVGAEKGVYDNAMLKNDLEDVFVSLYRWAENYIKATQDEEHDPEIWQWYSKLCRRWIRERNKVPIW